MSKFDEYYGDPNKVYIKDREIKIECDKLEQLLIYKGNLTEAELKAENEKDIKLR